MVRAFGLYEVKPAMAALLQGCMCRTGVHSSCDGMSAGSFCMMEFPRLVGET